MLMVLYNNSLPLYVAAWKQALLPISIGALTLKASQLTSLEATMQHVHPNRSVRKRLIIDQTIIPLATKGENIHNSGGKSPTYFYTSDGKEQRCGKMVTNESKAKLTAKSASSRLWTNKRKGKVCNGETRLEELCSKINNLQNNTRSGIYDEVIDILSDNVNKNSEDWDDNRSEVPAMVLDIECQILKDLVSKIVNAEVGEKYVSVAQFKECVTYYALENGLSLWYKRSSEARVVAKCGQRPPRLSDPEKGKQRKQTRYPSDSIDELPTCPWRCYARWMTEEQTFQCISLEDEHTCVTNFNYGSLVNYKWIAKIFGDKIRANPDIRLCDIVDLVIKKYKCKVTLNQCINAKKYALT
ncbi:multidrug resistance-associated protein 5 [Tanacetum coccineum]